MLTVGAYAPEVTLRDEHGADIGISAWRGKTLVLYFYPKDRTPGCTAQACAFRDAYEAFVAAGATIVGVSGDSAASHAVFAKKHGLQFRLLSDPDGNVRRAFDVGKTFGVLPGRVTFVIDADGTVRHAFNSAFAATKHVNEALRVALELAADAPMHHEPKVTGQQ